MHDKTQSTDNLAPTYTYQNYKIALKIQVHCANSQAWPGAVMIGMATSWFVCSGDHGDGVL
jgi:hypothetical protein